MFEILGALFGGAYLAGRIASEKSAHRSAQAIQKSYEYTYKTITNIQEEK